MHVPQTVVSNDSSSLFNRLESQIQRQFSNRPDLLKKREQFPIKILPQADNSLELTAFDPQSGDELYKERFSTYGNQAFLSEKDYQRLSEIERDIEARAAKAHIAKEHLQRSPLTPPVRIVMDASSLLLLAHYISGETKKTGLERYHARDWNGPSYLTLLEDLASLGVDIVIPKVVEMETLRKPNAIKDHFFKYAVDNNLIPGIRIEPGKEIPSPTNPPSFMDIISSGGALTPETYLILENTLATNSTLTPAQRKKAYAMMSNKTITKDLGEKQALHLMQQLQPKAYFITEDKKAMAATSENCSNLAGLFSMLERHGVLQAISGGRDTVTIMNDIEQQVRKENEGDIEKSPQMKGEPDLYSFLNRIKLTVAFRRLGTLEIG